jgi:hypothetical protein
VAASVDTLEVVCSNLVAGKDAATQTFSFVAAGNAPVTGSVVLAAPAPAVAAQYVRASKTLTVSVIPAAALYVTQGAAVTFAINSLGFSADETAAQCFLSVPDVAPIATTPAFTHSTSGLVITATVATDFSAASGGTVSLKCTGIIAPTASSAHSFGVLTFGTSARFTRVAVAAVASSATAFSVVSVSKAADFAMVRYTVAVSPAASVDSLVPISYVLSRQSITCGSSLINGAIVCEEVVGAISSFAASKLTFTVTDIAGVEHTLLAALPASDFRAPEGTRVTVDREARTVTFVAQRGSGSSIAFRGLGLPSSLLSAMQCNHGPKGALLDVTVDNNSSPSFAFDKTSDGPAGPADWVTIHCESARMPALGVAAHARAVVYYDPATPAQFFVPVSGFPDATVKAVLSLDAPYPGVLSRLIIDMSSVTFPAQVALFTVDVEVPSAARGVIAATTAAVPGTCSFTDAACTNAELSIAPASGLWRITITPTAPGAGVHFFTGLTAVFQDVSLGARASALTAPTTAVIRFIDIAMPAGTTTLPVLRAPASQRQDFAMRRVGPIAAPATAPAALVAGSETNHVIDFFTPVGLPSAFVVTMYQTYPEEKRKSWSNAPCVSGCTVVNCEDETLTVKPTPGRSVPANSTVSLTLRLHTPSWISLGGYDYRFVVSDAAATTIYGTGVYNPGSVVAASLPIEALVPQLLRPGQAAPLILGVERDAPHPTESVDYIFSFSARRAPYFTIVGGALACNWTLVDSESTVGFPVPVEMSDDGRTFNVKYQAAQLSNAIKLAIQANSFTRLVRTLKCSNVRHVIVADPYAADPFSAAFTYTAAFGNGTVFSTGFVPFNRAIVLAPPTVPLVLTDAVSYSRGSIATAAVPWADTETVPQGATVDITLMRMSLTALSTCTLNGIQLAHVAGSVFTVPAAVAIAGSVQVSCEEVLFSTHAATANAGVTITMPKAVNVIDVPVFAFKAEPASAWPNALTVATLAPGADNTNTTVVTFEPLRYDLVSGNTFSIELAEFPYRSDGTAVQHVCRNSTGASVATWDLTSTLFKMTFTTAVARTRTAAAVFVCAGIERPVDKRFQQFSKAAFVISGVADAPATPILIDNAGVLAAVGIAEFGQVSRSLTPANATAGSVFGTLTVAVAPVPQEIPAGGFFRVGLPLSWSVSDVVSCRASVRSANPNSAELSARAVRSPFPSAAEFAKAQVWGAVKADTDARWVEVVFAAAVPPTEDTLYVFCDSVKVSEKPSAEITTDAYTDKTALHYTSLRIYDRRHRPLMQSGWAMIPPVLATVAPVRQVQQTFSVARSQPFTAAELIAVTEAIAASVGVDAALVTVVRQAVISSEAAAAHGAAVGDAAAPEASATLRVTYQVAAAPAEIVEDVQRNVGSKSAAVSAAIARGADTPVLQMSKLAVSELDAGCFNGALDGDETDTDCGGATCQPCGNAGACTLNADCVSNTCRAGRCANPNAASGPTAGAAAAVVAALVAVLVLGV